MTTRIEVRELAAFDDAFGEVGLRVSSRTDGRTHDEKEWYVLRRFLKCALLKGCFKSPVTIEKAKPPNPDFRVELNGITTWIEITEATSNADQIEMAKIGESHSQSIMSGEFGGRYPTPALGNRPERDWAADVLRAIRRKRKKTVFAGKEACHLVVFVNSNPGVLVNEIEAFATLYGSFRRIEVFVHRVVNGALVHVVSRTCVCLDVLGSRVTAKREFEPYLGDSAASDCATNGGLR